MCSRMFEQVVVLQSDWTVTIVALRMVQVVHTLSTLNPFRYLSMGSSNAIYYCILVCKRYVD